MSASCTASNEGMPDPAEGVQKESENHLDVVVKAKDKIGEKPNTNRQ